MAPESLRHLSTEFLCFLRPRRVSVVLLCLLINGCGSANRPVGHSAPAPPPTAPTAPTARAPAGTAPTGTASGAPSTTTTAPGTTSASGGASNVRLPATFTITGRGSLRPPSVSAPAGVAIDLTVSSGDGRAHQVVVGTSPPRPLAVPAGGRASLELRGLKVGRYELTVDGAAAGALVVGVQPGP